jgi:hypothetical protein
LANLCGEVVDVVAVVVESRAEFVDDVLRFGSMAPEGCDSSSQVLDVRVVWDYRFRILLDGLGLLRCFAG